MCVVESGIWRIRLYAEGGYGFDVAEDNSQRRMWFVAGEGWADDAEVPRHVARRLLRRARKIMGL